VVGQQKSEGTELAKRTKAYALRIIRLYGEASIALEERAIVGEACMRLSALFTLHSSLCTLHSALFTLHSSLRILHSAFFPARFHEPEAQQPAHEDQ